MMSLFQPLLLLATVGFGQAQVRFECDPCVERSGYKIQAITHGSDKNVHDQQVHAAMMQAAQDMKVQFGLTTLGDDASDPQTTYANMALNIKEAAKTADALVVTIPDPIVQTAVSEVITSGTPVFGYDSGYEVAKEIKISSFIGMDEIVAGQRAAEHFVQPKSGGVPTTVTRALFIATEDSNSATYQKRMDGLQKGLQNYTATATVSELKLSTMTNGANTIAAQLEGCPFQAILIGTPNDALLVDTIAAVKLKNCQATTKVGTFGSSVEIHRGISAGTVAFTVSQQPYLQGALSVVHAALYVSTGKHLAPSSESEYGMVLAGPEVLDTSTVYTDTMQICEQDAFPTCPNQMRPDGLAKSQCDCKDRKKMKIAGVLHAVTTDEFWYV